MKTVVAALDKAQWSLASVQSTREAETASGAVHHQPVAEGRGQQAGLQCAPQRMGVAQRLYEGIEVAAEEQPALLLT